MDKLYDTPLKAIRKKCLDCSYWQPKEVRKCVIVDCPIYPYRFGRRPNESIIDTLEQFYKEKVEPSEGF
tara:strand:+ start:2292 stop:2498 length:207 start_codon:yes stop_codon:yes gene_type:complete